MRGICESQIDIIGTNRYLDVVVVRIDGFFFVARERLSEWKF